MDVFISHTPAEAQLAGELASALRGRGSDVWLDAELAPGEDRAQRIDAECAKADALVVLVGVETARSKFLETEWRAFLRHDLANSKPLIPVLTRRGVEVPPFIRHRKSILATNLDNVVRGIERLLSHPEESISAAVRARSKAELERRMESIYAFALALKDQEKSGVSAGDARY